MAEYQKTEKRKDEREVENKTKKDWVNSRESRRHALERHYQFIFNNSSENGK